MYNPSTVNSHPDIMMSPCGTTPRRCEVERLGGALDSLEKTMEEHAGRIDPVLRPDDPRACKSEALPAPEPKSRLAMLVNRVNRIRDGMANLTERVEA